MNTLIQDLKFGLRMLAKNPGFTFVVVLTLALGIGANTAIFSVVNGVLLAPLPYPGAARLISVYQKTGGGNYNVFSTPNFLAWRDQVRAFERFGAIRPAAFNFSGGGQPERLMGADVSVGIFPLLGVNPILGRVFLDEEDRPGGPRVVILSYGFWQRRFGGDPHILGRPLTLNGASYTVVGVMARGFKLPQNDGELWAPLQLNPADVNGASRGIHWIWGLARLRPGVSVEQAQKEADNLAHRLGQEYPETDAAQGLQLFPLIDDIVGNIRPVLWILLGAVGLVLLIACANVANLLLARASARQREIAVRAALGASRARTVGQMLTESFLVAVLGGTAGLVIAFRSVPALVSLAPAASIPRAGDIAVDGRVLIFTLMMTLVTGLVFGVIPALQASKCDLNEILKQSGRTSDSNLRHRRVRSALVVSEVAVAVMLLVGAGLLLRSFVSLRNVNPGFNTRHVLSLQLSVPRSKSSEEQLTDFRRQVVERVAALPGVASAALTRDLPLSGVDPSLYFNIEGRAPVAPGKEPVARWRMTTPGYFRTMGISLLAGRDFTDHDTSTSTGVAIISQAMARLYWPHEDPIGKAIRPGYPGVTKLCTIVGVVGDVRQWLPIDEPPTAYYPYSQVPASLGPIIFGRTTLVVRAASDPSRLVNVIRQEIHAIDSDAPVYQVSTMDELLAGAAASTRFQMVLLGIFATVGLLLAAVGIYGLISYSVTQRTREIGVRMALGAARRDVLRMVVGQGVILSLSGVGVGLAAALGLTRLMSSLLYGVAPTDPATFGLVPFGLLVVTVFASYIPARRATKVDPMEALRYE
jgi:putative ABC transport system permease protein